MSTSNIFDKVKVAVGVQGKHKFFMPQDHITTSSFMDLQPVFYRHCVPGENVSISASAISRMLPLVVPTYGRARINLRAFFVPFDYVMLNFKEFITDSVFYPYAKGTYVNPYVPTNSPFITGRTLSEFFIKNDGVIASEVQASDPYDFEFTNHFYRLERKGRQFYKLLTSLGYRWVFDLKNPNRYSALPILCFLRVYLDWYASSAFLNTVDVAKLEEILRRQDFSSEVIDVSELGSICNFVHKVCYDGDVFTSAWENPVGPNIGPNTNVPQFTQLSIQDPTTSSTQQISVKANGTPTSVSSNAVSEFALQAVHSLTDYMKRHQLAGARAVDRFLADYGVNVDNAKYRRSTYIGCKSIDVKIGDVMQTVNTNPSGSQSNLGDYAGRGFAGDSFNFDYSANDFGILFIMASILPSGGYWQGIDRNVLHLDKTDFYNPDFDCLGVQAIQKGEVYIPNNDHFYTSQDPVTGVYGFSQRYQEYKHLNDKLTGDFALRSQLAGGKSWHLMRTFEDDSFAGSSGHNVVITPDFVRGDDSAQYERIFSFTHDDYDPFYLVYHFDVSVLSPLKPLYDTYEFNHDGEVHKEIKMDSQGVKLN